MPSEPWEDDAGCLGKCLVSPGRCSLHFSLCGFSLAALYQHLILVQVLSSPSLHASLLSFSERSGRPNQADGRSLWCLNCPRSFPLGEQAAISHPRHKPVSALFLLRKNLLVLFVREWPSTFCTLLEAKLFLKESSHFSFIFFSSCHLFFMVKC